MSAFSYSSEYRIATIKYIPGFAVMFRNSSKTLLFSAGNGSEEEEAVGCLRLSMSQ